MLEVVAGYLRCAAAGMLAEASDSSALVVALRVLDLQNELDAEGVDPVYIGGDIRPEQALQFAAAEAAAGSPLQQALHRLLLDLADAKARRG